MSYDTKCYALAQAFMADHPAIKQREERTKLLAQWMQELIDESIEGFELEDEAAPWKAMYDAEKAMQSDVEDPRTQAHAERMYEAADMERKRLREEG